MFWHLPNSTNGTSVGWNGDIPVVVKDKAIFNPYKNVITKKLDINEIAILNNLSILVDNNEIYHHHISQFICF